MPSSYRTVIQPYATDTFTEKKSVFIADVARTDTEPDAKAFLEAIKKKYPDATHHCYAYILKDTGTARCSDDGEPSGTAGMPMLEVLKREGVSGVCVVATRYFGGILLGAGGLVRAYARTAKLGLDAAGMAEFVPYTVFELILGYGEYEKVAREAVKYGVTVSDTVFEADVRLVMQAKNEDFERFDAFVTEYTGGKKHCVKTGDTFGKK